MKKVIKNNYKFILGMILGLVISVSSVYAVEAYIESNKVSYDNSKSKGSYKEVQSSIDELYERSGIHKEKWIDKTLNGADPVLKDPLIPVEIKPNGDVYYANLNSEWYNYSEKRWANAVILVDNPSNTNYSVGDHILEKDIESYFVWIPRYQYKIWDLGNYTTAPNGNTLTNQDYATSTTQALNKSRIIDIKFGNVTSIPKMNENEASLNEYYTHPAFTLGNKDLNGIWVGKFETGGTIDSPIIKPSVESLRNKTVKEFFTAGKSFATGLDSHMMKNTEWGAAAYLSHSQYGIGNEVNINNTEDYYTGYSAAPNTDQSSREGTYAVHTEASTTQPWNTPTGYLASTTGNINGIYDMSGGAWEYVAAYRKGSTIANKSGFSAEEITTQILVGYIDEYEADSEVTTYNKMILGDATGEIGPFYQYYDKDGSIRYHNSWYGDRSFFVSSTDPWFGRGGFSYDGGLAGQFGFDRGVGSAGVDRSFRIALAIQ